MEKALYRICQESINNIVKHSKATEAYLSITLNSENIKLLIEDNGIGFNPNEILAGDRDEVWGLIGIEERVKLVFGIKIEVDNPDQQLKPGMPADAFLAYNP